MAADIKTFSIDNIDQTETVIWLRDQLVRLCGFVVQHEGDDDVL